MDEAVPLAITEFRDEVGHEVPTLVEKIVQRFEAEYRDCADSELAECRDSADDRGAEFCRGSEDKEDKEQQGRSRNRPTQSGGNPWVATVPTVVRAMPEEAEEVRGEAGAQTQDVATECVEQCEEPSEDAEQDKRADGCDDDTEGVAQVRQVCSKSTVPQRRARIQGAQNLASHKQEEGTEDQGPGPGLPDAGEPPAGSPGSAAMRRQKKEHTKHAKPVGVGGGVFLFLMILTRRMREWIREGLRKWAGAPHDDRGQADDTGRRRQEEVAKRRRLRRQRAGCSWLPVVWVIHSWCRLICCAGAHECATGLGKFGGAGGELGDVEPRSGHEAGAFSW